MKNNRGFTLIELVVLIAILGILSTIAMPKFSGFIERAKINADKSTIRTLNNTTDIYMVTKKGGKEVFNNAENDKSRIEILSNAEFLYDNIEPQHKDGSFTWDVNNQYWYYSIREGKPLVELSEGDMKDTVTNLYKTMNAYISNSEEDWINDLETREKISSYNIERENISEFFSGYFKSVDGIDINKISNFEVFFDDNKVLLGVYIKIKSEWSQSGPPRSIYFSDGTIVTGSDADGCLVGGKLIHPNEK